MSRPTPLHDVHIALGAAMTDFAGWSMPVRYTSDIAEHAAVRTTAGLFDLTHMGEIELRGAQAGAALDHSLVSNVSALAIGKAKYTMLCSEAGGILDDLIVYRLGQEHFLVVANAANTQIVLKELRQRCTSFDTRVQDCSQEWALLALQGPDAVGLLARLTDTDLSQVRYYSISTAQVADSDVLLARTGYTGEDGFELFCAPEQASQLWHELSEAGGGGRVTPCGLASRDSLRLEAGMPLYGHELNASVTPFDVGLGRVVQLDRQTTFVGGDALTVRAHIPNYRRLVGLHVDGRRPARAGYNVRDGNSGPTLGVITSGGPSPTLGIPIAIAFLHTDQPDDQLDIHIDIRGTPTPATVVPLPFYRRAKETETRS